MTRPTWIASTVLAALAASSYGSFPAGRGLAGDPPVHAAADSLAVPAAARGDAGAGEPPTPEARFVARESILAIVTHRGGFAKKLAHDHLIAAPLDAVHLRFQEEDPAASSFFLEFPAEALLVDDPELRARWSGRLVDLGLLAEPLPALGEKDRAKICSAMLGAGQLDASGFPTLRVELESIREEPTQAGSERFPYALGVAFTVRGTTVHRILAGRVLQENGCPSLEALGTLAFTALGIRPYSAFLGAVRNQDEMETYLHLALDCRRD